jgi:hypothetical protein
MGFLTQDKLEQLAKDTQSKSRYINPSKLAPNEPHRFRFIGEGITGHEAWTVDNTPRRWELKPSELPEDIRPDENGNRTCRPFLAGIVWDYSDKSLKVMQITQKTLLQSIHNYLCEEDYAQISHEKYGYDIKITREGEKLNTKYTLLNMAPKPLAEEIKAAYDAESDRIDLQKLFTNDEVFG